MQPYYLTAEMGGVPETISIMSRTAREAARTFAVQEWASRLATLAGPRDYVGQLRALYSDVLSRWRYTGEMGERVMATPRALIGIVAGAGYNLPPGTDVTRIALSQVRREHKGWGDCDDVSTLIAAGVLALGMRPEFRVVRLPSGGHVSVIAHTQDGQSVSLDPVGHPTHPFGWAQPAPKEKTTMYPITSLQGIPTPYGEAVSRSYQMTPAACRGTMPTTSSAYLSPFGGQKVAPHGPAHFVAVPRDNIIPAAIAIENTGEPMGCALCAYGLVGVDELGREWTYNQDNDVWRMTADTMGLASEDDLEDESDDNDEMGNLAGRAERQARRARRRARRRRILKRIGRKVRKVVSRVKELHDKVVSKIMQSKAAQRIVGAALQVFGIPMQATAGVMRASSEIIKKGGVIGLVKLLRKNPKAALQLVAAAAKKGLIDTGMVPDAAKQFLSAIESGGVYVQTINGRNVAVAPLGALVELGAAGPAYRSGSGTSDKSAEIHNVDEVLRIRPQSIGRRRRKSGQSESDWYTDAAFEATYPAAPMKLPKGSPYIAGWLRLNAIVRQKLAALPAASKTTPSRPVTPNTPVTPPPLPADGRAGDLAGNVALALKRASTENDRTNEAYWMTWPSSPRKIPAGDKTNAARWIQARAEVRRQASVIAPTRPVTPTTSTPTRPVTPTTSTPTRPVTPTTPTTDCWEDEDAQESVCVAFRTNPAEQSIARGFANSGSETDATDAAYAAAYPDGPSRIPDTGAPNFKAAWLRLRGYIRQARATTPTRPQDLPDITTRPQDLPKLPDVTTPQTQTPGGMSLSPMMIAGAAALAIFAMSQGKNRG